MARQVRISGLIRAADVVRRELAGPITAEQKDRLRQQVQENLRKAREILAEHRASVRQLPGPSQRAYQFLANVDWSSVPTAQDQGARPALLSWTGLTRLMDHALDRLADDLPPAELAKIGQTLLRTSRKIEATIQRRAATADQLSPRMRGQRGWLGLFGQPENLALYVKARKTASRLLDAAAIGSKHYPPPLKIHFRPVTGIYKLSGTRGARPTLWLPTPMIVFDAGGFATLADLVFDRGHNARQRVIALMTHDDYQAVRAEFESLCGIVDGTRGAAHDLAASFDRVNAQYFGGVMARPRLTWNRAFTGRKFGHYDWVQDTVMVSRTLDSPLVPEFVVDFLVFHELLHKFHGLHWVNGRGYAHTAEFLASERTFARHEEAEAVLQELASSAK